MNFSAAFKYPFQNLAKVVSIVLALTIGVALALGLLLSTQDWSPWLEQLFITSSVPTGSDSLVGVNSNALLSLLVLIIVVIIEGFWLSGYSIEVIRSVVRGEETMPAIEFVRNLKGGFYLFLSSLAYWALSVIAAVAVVLLFSVSGSLSLLGGLISLASVLGMAALLFVLGWAYFVGMARFAVEGDHRAAWQIRHNMGIARQNWRSGFGLLVYLVFLSIIYSVVRSVADGVFAGIVQPGLLITGLTLSALIYYMFNLMQHFSTQHLIAQYAVNIGIRGADYDSDKDKVDFV